MLRFYSMALLFLAWTLSASGQEQERREFQDSSGSSLELHQQNSTPTDGRSLPPLSLEPVYGVYPDSLSTWYLTPYRNESWLSVPKFYRGAPSSYRFLLGEYPYESVEPTVVRMQSDSWMLQTKGNLLAPWKLQLQSQEKYRIWRTILGSVQMGGTAYLLYLHLKKYGFK